MQTVVLVFERDPVTDFTGILKGIYASKELAIAELTQFCKEGEEWAREYFANFSNKYFTVSEDIVQTGPMVDSTELMDFHNNKRFFQKYNWNGLALVETAGVPIDISVDY